MEKLSPMAVVDRFRAEFPWKPSGTYLLILPFIQASQTKGGIHLAPAGADKPTQGLVIEAGPGKRTSESGQWIDVERKVGDVVLFAQHAGIDPGELLGRPWLLLADGDALGTRVGEPQLVLHPDKWAVHFEDEVCEHCPTHEGTGEDRLERRRELAGMMGSDDHPGPRLTLAD